ncbi:MAG: hypothetical protein PHX54_04405 [Lentimicrobiaceae bacterium]|nr:hypothetical protein [Lentimicrobiaceae bacterium]
MLKKDNFFIGFFLSLALIALTGLLVWLLAPVVTHWFNQNAISIKTILLSAIPSILLMRWYFRVLRAERSGMGAVVAILIFIILYFLLLDGKPLLYFMP